MGEYNKQKIKAYDKSIVYDQLYNILINDKKELEPKAEVVAVEV